VSRGQYGSRSLVVGGFGDQLRIERLTHEYDATYRALAEQAKARPEWSGFFAAAVEPVFKEWRAFRQSAGATLDPASYKTWSDKLDVIRAGAKCFGMKPQMSLGTVGLIGGGVVLGLVVLAAVTRS